MKFPNEVPFVVDWGNGPFYPSFAAAAAALQANIFLKSCKWVTCNNNKYTNEMQNICNFQIFSKSPLLYPKFVQIFQIGPKHTIDFQGLASF